MLRSIFTILALAIFGAAASASELRFQGAETGFAVSGDALLCAHSKFLYGEPAVEFRLNEPASKQLAELTAANIGKEIVMSLDGREVQRAVVREAITGGTVVISGGFSIADTKAMVGQLGAPECPKE